MSDLSIVLTMGMVSIALVFVTGYTLSKTQIRYPSWWRGTPVEHWIKRRAVRDVMLLSSLYLLAFWMLVQK